MDPVTRDSTKRIIDPIGTQVLPSVAMRRLTLLVLIALLSLDRIGMGGHFLSDVFLAWWITLAVIAVAYRVLYLDPPPALAPDRLEDAMTRAGNAIRSLVVRSPAA